MALFNKTKAYMPFKNISDEGTTDMWTQSETATEYYYNQADLPAKPLNVEVKGSNLVEGTIGSLAYKEWAWGDNLAMSAFSLYIRLDPDAWAATAAKVVGDTIKSTAGDYYECTVAGTTGASEPTWDTVVGNTTADDTVTWIRVENISADPDGLAAGDIRCSEFVEIFQAAAAKETIVLSTLIANTGDTDADIVFIITDSSDVVLYTMLVTLTTTDGPLTMQEKIVIPPEGKVKIMSSSELVSASITEDES